MGSQRLPTSAARLASGSSTPTPWLFAGVPIQPVEADSGEDRLDMPAPRHLLMSLRIFDGPPVGIASPFKIISVRGQLSLYVRSPRRPQSASPPTRPSAPPTAPRIGPRQTAAAPRGPPAGLRGAAPGRAGNRSSPRSSALATDQKLATIASTYAAVHRIVTRDNDRLRTIFG